MVVTSTTPATAAKLHLPYRSPYTVVPSCPRHPPLPYRRRPPLLCLRASSPPAPPSSAGPDPGDILSVFSAPGDDPASRRLARLVDEFRSLPEPLDRVKRLLAYASALPPLPEPDRAPSNRVAGCTAQVWLSVSVDVRTGRLHFAADSDSEITRGFCACLVRVLDGSAPGEVLGMRPEDFGDLNVVGRPGMARSRANTWHNVFISMQKRTAELLSQGEGLPPAEPFPSLVMRTKGSYAEA